MKKLSLVAAILFSIFITNASTAQSKTTETIKVWGNCGMCKTKIEKAAKTAGAKTANWNEDSKELKVTYAVNKTSSAKIQEAIANSGYDTQDFTAVKAAYDNLPGCCKYDRKGDAGDSIVYTCPMHADVTSDKPGKCSKCGMDLKEKQNVAVVYACPMKCEGDKTYNKAGRCPVCGMNLKEKKDDHSNHND